MFQRFEEYLDDLRHLYLKFREYKLHANRNQCCFVWQSIKLLRHLIIQAGVLPDQDEVRAIRDMMPPTKKKFLRSFVQTCLLFRTCVPNFAKNAESLTRITPTNVAWI